MTTSATPPEFRTLHEPEQPGLTDPYSSKPPARKWGKRGLIWVVFLLIIAGVAGYAVWRAGRPVAPPANANFNRRGGAGPRGGAGLGPVPVVVAKAARSSVPFYLNGLGNVSAFYTVTVKSRVDGQIMKVAFNEGDLVKEGQVLIQIDPRPYQVQLEMAQGALAHDQAILNAAQIDLDRYKSAYARNAIAKQQLDDQEQAVLQYQGTVKQDMANVDNAKLQLIYANVTAPITGVVGLRLVDPGNIVHAADTTGMIIITQLQPIAVLFTIPEDNLPEVTQKLRAGIHLPVDAYNRDNSKKLASGTLITLDNQIDNTTGTAKLKAIFDNKNYELFPQQFVNMRVLVDTLQDQLVVPNVAVQNGQQGNFVYVVDDRSRVHLRTVQVGITSDKTADILSGISDGDQVVVDGTDRLVDGAQVRVRTAAEIENMSRPAGAGGRGGRGAGGGGGRPDGAAGRPNANGAPGAASGPGAADGASGNLGNAPANSFVRPSGNGAGPSGGNASGGSGAPKGDRGPGTRDPNSPKHHHGDPQQ
jgi:membrane fusion protein, multidrug efflux system